MPSLSSHAAPPRAGATSAETVAAKKAGLRYGDDSRPGIRRQPHGARFVYVDAHNKTIKDAQTLARIRSLVIPPAWKNVWIAPRGDWHLQATGRDAKGRKQYRYHPKWREARDKDKYASLISFAKALPTIRRRVRRDMARRGLPREKVLASVVRLLETTLIRVGNDEYARQNHSFGLTTLEDGHAQVRGKKVCFRFRGKSGVKHAIELESPTLARIVKRCQDLPGQQLFQYEDQQGGVHDLTSTDVNQYLREISGSDISAKDFRTWAGTALAAQALKEFEAFDSNARAKRNVTRAIEHVASRLGNTTSVCRKCYVHPAVIDAYMDQTLLKTLEHRAASVLKHRLKELTPEEAAVLALLQSHIRQRAHRKATH